MSTSVAAPFSAGEMAGFLTAPYQRGAEMLNIPVGADTANETALGAYDFTLYNVRYGSDPVDPRYVLLLNGDLGADALTVEVDYQAGAATATAIIAIPAGTLGGASWCIPLPTPVSSALRLTKLRQKPQPLSGTGAANFGVVALLGNIAKFLWVIGGEKDLLKRQFRLIQRQRHRAESRAASLDLLGKDLRVPRFPAREYSFGPGTIALYHLNEANPATAAFSDEATRFGLPGHPATNTGASPGVTGKFDSGVRFPGAAGNGVITIPDSPDFAIAATASFAVEMFVSAVAASSGSRVLASKGVTDASAALSGPGWVLALDTARGFNNNPRWALSDGVAANAVHIFADMNLADGNFHHVAGVIDRGMNRARLFIDGIETANADIPSLGALTNAEPVRIGRGAGGNQFAGLVDEIRLSSVARGDFHPALGESDDAYRKRLGIFERWMLPTPASIIGAINDAVQVNGDPQSFVLAEAVRPIEAATTPVRFIPASVPAGTSIDIDGDTLTSEAQVCGMASDDKEFDPAVLVQQTAPTVTYAKANTMQLVTRNALSRLLELLAGQPGNLLIDNAYDAAGAGLHRVGRSLTMRHSALTVDALALLAHRARFDFVSNNGLSMEGSVATGEHLEIDIEAPGPANASVDVFAAQAIQLKIDPAPLPAAGRYRWTLIECGAGAAHFAAHPADNPALKTPVTSRPHLQLVGETAGPIAVKVEYVLNGVVHWGTRTILIDIPSLADGVTITPAGLLNAAEDDVLGPAGPLVNTIYLINSALANVNFGANPDNKRMQIGMEKPFNALAASVPAGLTVVSAFNAAATDRHRTALAMVVQHTTLTPDALGAAAHQAGFDFVQRQGTEIYCAVAQRDKIGIVDATTLAPIAKEFTVGVGATITTRPAVPATGTFSWVATPQSRGEGAFDNSTRAQVRLTPRATGFADLTIPYVERGAGELPYRFEVTLNAALEAANATIPKEDFDLIMNILNFFHPIGTEILTGDIRKHVVEIEQDPLKAAPAYTFPDFRV